MFSAVFVVTFALSWPLTVTALFLSPISSYVPRSPLVPRQNAQHNNDHGSVEQLDMFSSKFFANALCTENHKRVERRSWIEASKYAEALASWQVNGTYQEALDLYMGNSTRGPLGKIVEGRLSIPSR